MVTPQASAREIYDLGDNIIRHVHKGEMLMDRKRYDEAVAEFKIALEFNQYSSMSSGLYNNLGLCYLHLKDWPMALAAFQRAIRMHPNFALYYRNLVYTYVKSGNSGLAIDQLLAVTDRNPADAEAWYLLGTLYQQEKNPSEAQQCFQRFVDLQPNAPLAKKLKQSLPES